MDHVFTNSLTALGREETCVSRSAMWMTLVPVAWLSRANDPSASLSAAAISFSNATLFTPVAAGRPLSSIAAPISSSARFVKWLTRPGLAPWSMMAVAVGLPPELSRSLRSRIRICREYRLRS